MDVTQYLAFVPLLIYGMSITTLMVDWKRIIDFNQMFIPYSLLSLVLSETAIYNLFVYIRIIAKFKEFEYLSYLLYQIPPTIFYIMVNVFTPDTGFTTRTYFMNRMRLFYILFALMLASHFLFDHQETQYAHFIRIFLIAYVILIAIFRKIWMTYILVGLWILSFISRGDIIAFSR